MFVGNLFYLTTTCLDIVFIVNYFSRFMQSPSQTYFFAAKRVLRYQKGTVEFDICFVKSSSIKLGFSDNDWAGSADEIMSTLGYCFATREIIFCYNSKKHSVVAHSIIEIEYIVLLPIFGFPQKKKFWKWENTKKYIKKYSKEIQKIIGARKGLECWKNDKIGWEGSKM